jgi:hypothetical protein
MQDPSMIFFEQGGSAPLLEKKSYPQPAALLKLLDRAFTLSSVFRVSQEGIIILDMTLQDM